MSYVFDSSSLIYFGKSGVLEKVALLKGRKIIPKKVYDEVVVKGFERGDFEASYIDGLIKKRAFVILETKSNIVESELLSDADKEVLSLAKENRCVCVMDEIYGNSVAESLGIESHGSVFILIKLVKEKIISKKELKKYLDEMIGFGFYLGVGIYNEVLKVLERI